MGEAILDEAAATLTIHANVFLYGTAATQEMALAAAAEIESLWNEPEAGVFINDTRYVVRFAIHGAYREDLTPEEVWYNDNPRNNYFRVEPYAKGNISYVDALGSNTGYFLLDNMRNNSTTAAHEFGHTLGLPHPQQLDIRGHGAPGIMYPRGTWVDPPFQYDPAAQPGAPGGTMHPKNRKVWNSEIQALRLDRLLFKDNRAVVGEFTSLYHDAETP